MFPGETLHTGAKNPCPTCDTHLEVEVLHSGAGYYIGSACNCGPYTRESEEYYRTYRLAEAALKDDTWTRRSAAFNG